VAFLLISAGDAMAFSTQKEENKITVSIQNEEGKNVIGIVVKKGDDPMVVGNVYSICETDGETLVFTMPDYKEDVDNEYTLYISGVEKCDFYYAKVDSMSSVKRDFVKMTDTDFEDALTSGSDVYYVLGAMGFDLEAYASLTQNAELARNMFLTVYKESMTQDETANLFNKAVALVSINNGGSVAEALKSVNPEFIDTAYKDAPEELKIWIEEYMSQNTPIADVEDFNKKYKLANILYLLDNAKFSQVNGLFITYDTELGLTTNSDYDKYKALASAKQTIVHEKLVEAFNANPCKSTDILANALKNALSAAISSSGGGGGSSGGSGSSGNSNKTSSSLIESSFRPAEKPVTVFNDLDSVKWAEEAINTLAKKEIVIGDGTGAFMPMEPVTREQYVKMIVSATNMPVVDANTEFEDVDSDVWYAKYVAAAYNSRVIFGITDKIFGIGTKISRQDMAVIAYRALGDKPLEKKRDFVEFKDVESISLYAYDAVKALYEAEIISGKGSTLFDPLGTATRAESALVIYNLFVKQ